ncbi:uncharacterized protein LOC101857979 [Aplysia californica]|uniref:Uncharacterized protein LOC101857979 n=1 Tax=Aplysia californica TaxID=6500 RepID=A0ABM0K3M3_APLCA|nr:uncharacterized protein LOC101857979 [Aplysia californica]
MSANLSPRHISRLFTIACVFSHLSPRYSLSLADGVTGPHKIIPQHYALAGEDVSFPCDVTGNVSSWIWTGPHLQAPPLVSSSTNQTSSSRVTYQRECVVSSNNISSPCLVLNIRHIRHGDAGVYNCQQKDSNLDLVTQGQRLVVVDPLPPPRQCHVLEVPQNTTVFVLCTTRTPLRHDIHYQLKAVPPPNAPETPLTTVKLLTSTTPDPIFSPTTFVTPLNPRNPLIRVTPDPPLTLTTPVTPKFFVTQTTTLTLVTPRHLWTTQGERLTTFLAQNDRPVFRLRKENLRGMLSNSDQTLYLVVCACHARLARASRCSSVILWDSRSWRFHDSDEQEGITLAVKVGIALSVCIGVLLAFGLCTLWAKCKSKGTQQVISGPTYHTGSESEGLTTSSRTTYTQPGGDGGERGHCYGGVVTSQMTLGGEAGMAAAGGHRDRKSSVVRREEEDVERGNVWRSTRAEEDVKRKTSKMSTGDQLCRVKCHLCRAAALFLRSRDVHTKANTTMTTMC